jgi:hypothetical protein
MVHLGLLSLGNWFRLILFGLALARSFFATSAVTPPAELALVTINAAVAMHAGHMDSSRLSSADG